MSTISPASLIGCGDFRCRAMLPGVKENKKWKQKKEGKNNITVKTYQDEQLMNMVIVNIEQMMEKSVQSEGLFLMINILQI